MPSVLQPWVHDLTFMQQSVLFTSIRGPDGVRKYDPPKMLLRWFRRCFLISALDQTILTDPIDLRGGSFTGPSISVPQFTYETSAAYRHCLATWEDGMKVHADAYVKDLDAIPHHFQMHFLHSCHIVGVYHPDKRIAKYWKDLYVRLVHEMHLMPEADEAMAKRLGDNRENWLERGDPATSH